MKVFGIGLEKTGTNTLGRALEILGFESHKGFDLDLLKAVVEGDVAHALSKAESFNNFENYPWALIYRELYHRFPDAKFILTVRTTPHRWFNSLSHHARRTGPDEARQLIYGHAMPNLFEEEDVAFYKKHIRDVNQFFEEHDPSKLLEVCWAKEDGWNEICEFLNLPVPDEAFPHLKR